MLAVGEDDLLRQAIGLCSRSAVASKAAFMLTLDRADERALLERCTDRYTLLECLLGLLSEGDLRPEEVRRLLATINLDLSSYTHAKSALAVLRLADDRLASLLAGALTDQALSPHVEACFESALTRLGPLARCDRPDALVPNAIAGCGRELAALD
ncbi:MAG: hypothetical protein U1E17_00865 [Geminicoccaceae bacterium]